MDQYAVTSQSRALAAIESGFLAKQIVPINVGEGKSTKTFEIDEDPLFRLGGYNLMGQLKNFPTKQTRDRYHRLTDIAKEYVAQCGREDNRITL